MLGRVPDCLEVAVDVVVPLPPPADDDAASSGSSRGRQLTGSSATGRPAPRCSHPRTTHASSRSRTAPPPAPAQRGGRRRRRRHDNARSPDDHPPGSFTVVGAARPLRRERKTSRRKTAKRIGLKILSPGASQKTRKNGSPSAMPASRGSCGCSGASATSRRGPTAPGGRAARRRQRERRWERPVAFLSCGRRPTAATRPPTESQTPANAVREQIGRVVHAERCHPCPVKE